MNSLVLNNNKQRIFCIKNKLSFCEKYGELDDWPKKDSEECLEKLLDELLDK